LIPPDALAAAAAVATITGGGSNLSFTLRKPAVVESVGYSLPRVLLLPSPEEPGGKVDSLSFFLLCY